MFGFSGPWELILIAGIVLLLFGNRLPGVMRSLGRGVVEFKKGVSGIEDQTEAGESQTSPTSSSSTTAPSEKEPETAT
ncbi:MAG: twin-arginine translocase TatA/TatE family subunit [Planctomycetota bacterium]|nr:MAG: twin-arginine translocase TatA/TatE family subunit [Planctomycetota bacterium]REJ88032.1 MAG: twin-arginine translocase TatA/TatE family subunit [Planctomycetota bacterium]REK29972.1 MAG: twin-arginine translocase TatA/TatE family subunit [Planctomycetota bacterium]REK48014.1 MAG: twin-arginine translocase TatA/TatE family subunit [Planctomycetota bacterium]